ncbi:MAG TPA: hypothetical protein ENI57_01845 [Ignavibacteria bacterium]|mgnify:CR=1 FL=1|nr:hypothetical protein [Ignavibacteria bacterium]
MITTPTAINIKSPYYGAASTAFSGDEADLVQSNFIKALEHFTKTTTTETLEQKFKRLSTNWKEDNKFSSRSSLLLSNIYYLGIIAMGQDALPYIFEDLKKGPNHWFIALAIITGANPVSEESRGNILAMTEAWISWGKEHGYTS